MAGYPCFLAVGKAASHTYPIVLFFYQKSIEKLEIQNHISDDFFLENSPKIRKIVRNFCNYSHIEIENLFLFLKYTLAG